MSRISAIYWLSTEFCSERLIVFILSFIYVVKESVKGLTVKNCGLFGKISIFEDVNSFCGG
jgi:hypothetical protein